MKQYEELAEKIKNIFEFIFDPFKQAWEIQGQSVMKSLYNAFKGVRNLTEAIVGSFAKIWSNGTVQTTAELLLKIFSDIFNIIGNIGNAWANAWRNNSNGDKIIQNIANAFNNLLSIIEGIFVAYEKWTSSESYQSFANAVVSICQTLSHWLEVITEKLKQIWDNGGENLFTSVLEFGGKVVEVIGAILERLSPVVDFVMNIVTPVISAIVDAIGWVIKALTAVLDFILNIFQRKLGSCMGWIKTILC